MNRLKMMNAGSDDCHHNCHSYASSDPTQQSRVVAGWRYEWDIYCLHSVILVNGDMLCLTPLLFTDTSICFVLDDKIICEIGNDGTYHHSRGGIKIDFNLRKYPEKSIAEAKIIEKHLLDGMNLSEAM